MTFNLDPRLGTPWIDNKVLFPDEHVLDILPFGSYFVCNPPVENTDKDFLVLTNNIREYFYYLKFMEVTFSIDDAYAYRGFQSGRIGDMNIIITDERERFDLYSTATQVVRTLNLTKKEDRLAVYDIVANSKLKFIPRQNDEIPY
jgi:hypothetical protein